MTLTTKTVAFQILVLVSLVCLCRAESERCPEGFFGNNCMMVCYCKGGNTNCDNGDCTQGCDKEHIGPFCQYSEFDLIGNIKS
ncbi:hypothetical protein ElyMa_000468300 [Elysia marginata]|uniref:EGF-like domain-containing protein n=1 Tax=Elysia marginata TaxID=1093978 RepID=A0AAV4FRG0_9GAST|nr:hypothetical protein ElyMa_000468300 [Elysia marginata]